MNLISSSPLASILADYETWLRNQPLSTNTRRTYLTQVRQYCLYLNQTVSELVIRSKMNMRETMRFVITRLI